MSVDDAGAGTSMRDDTLFEDDAMSETKRQPKKKAASRRHDGPRVKLTPEQQVIADRFPTREQDATRITLVETLRFAVPGWIAKANTWDPGRERLAVLKRWAEDAVEPLCARGDNMLFGSDRPGEAAGVFNHLARGIAALAHQPGGVRAFGLVWCVVHAPAGRDTTAPCCEQCATP